SIYNDDTRVSSFEGLAADAVKKVTDRGLQIGWMRIIAHGNSHGIQIGDTYLGEQTISKYKSELRSISSRMTDRAVVELYSCQTGLAGSFLLKMSEALDGRSVFAFKQNQNTGNLGS